MPRLALRPDAMYGINEYATKWIVVLKRKGKHIAKSFAFSTHGGHDAALAQAQAWRDVQIHRYPQTERRTLAQKPRIDNASGIPGVHCQCWPDGRPKRWHAKTNIGNGQILTKSYGVKQYGYDLARQLATAARERQLEHMRGRISFHPADAIDPNSPPPPAAISHRLRTSQSGLPGVRLTYSSAGLPESWISRTTTDGKRVQESFAISIHGEERAKALALAARERQLQRTGRREANSDGQRQAEPPAATGWPGDAQQGEPLRTEATA